MIRGAACLSRPIAGQDFSGKLRQYFKRWLASLVATALMIAGGAFAEPIESIRVGERYYINRIFAENDLVYVTAIDRATGRVKVQYANGTVDWVSAADLLTRSQASNADTGEAVGAMAIIAGGLWAIFDPEGFKTALRGNQTESPRPQSYARSEPSGPSAVAVSGVPFAPVVPGMWNDMRQDWIDWAETTLNRTFGKSVRLVEVRTKPIPWYSTGQRNVVLIECVIAGRKGAYYMLAVVGSNTVVLLDGNGASIHQFNRTLGLSLDSAEKAKLYLQFFTSAISASGGIFLVLDSGMEGIPAQTLRNIGVSPIVVSPERNGDWRITTDTLYGSGVYSTVFRVTRDGVVDMLGDQPKSRLAFDYLVAMEGGLRVYVRNN